MTLPLEQKSWYQAFTLAERASPQAGEAPSRAVDRDLARRRLEAWRAQSPFDRDGLFERRFAADGLDLGLLEALLGEDAEALENRIPDPPDWLDRLLEAYARPASMPLPEPRLPEPMGREASFLNLVEPLVHEGLERLRHGARSLAEDPSTILFDPGAFAELFYPILARRLVIMISRTTILELNVARLRGELEGESPKERFASFLQRLRRPEVALALFEEYPVLARQAILAIDLWVAFGLDVLRHLVEDARALSDTFWGGGEIGRLSGIRGGMGDSHQGGRSVLMVDFDGGARVVYKPKSLAVDVRFQELLGWLNGRGFEPAFRLLSVLDRGDHGWVERIDPAPCSSKDELRRFYRRQGGYLALLYLLDATDFHYENLIAAGEHPMLIDLEALFHPPVDGFDFALPSGYPGTALRHSVLRTGLLPLRLWGGEEHGGIDIGGLSSPGGQTTPEPVPSLEDPGTDRMRIVRRYLTLPGADNRPSLDGAEASAGDYESDVVEGFRDMVSLLLERREELWSPGGPLQAFAGVDVRAIVRPTRGYAMLLSESFHPDLLRDGLERDRHLDRLWLGVEERPDLARLLDAERRDLERIDVPIFTTRPGSKDLFTSRGDRLPDLFAETGLERARFGFERWGKDDLDRQTWLIRTSLSSVRLFAGPPRRVAYQVEEEPRPPAPEELIAMARRAGERLERLAFAGDRDATWVDFSPVGDDCWTLGSASPTLYSGLAGIALFLAHLGAETGEERFTGLARAALAGLEPILERAKPHDLPVGAFNGWSGLFYALTHLAALWRDPGLAAEAEGMIEKLPPAIDRDRSYDVIGGTAGCLLALLSIHRWLPSGRLLELAVRCGDRLLADAETCEVGIGWLLPDIAPIPLIGLSHGAGGIAWALTELAAASGRERYREAAREALRYERSLYDPERRNWPDLRPGKAGSDRKFMVAWCYGAPGVALARLGCEPHLDDAQLDGEIEIAIGTTLKQGLAQNHCLCHGDLGNLEILKIAAHAHGDGALAARVDRLAGGVLASIREHGFLCGLPRGAEPPGLMIGLAGIGYGLLRLAVPERVPSVLALEPPASPPTGS